LSKRHGLSVGTVPHVVAELALGHHIDLRAKQLSQCQPKAGSVEEAVVGKRIDEEVDIAPRLEVIARDGAEYPGIANPVLLGQPKNLGAPSANVCQRDWHGRFRREKEVGVRAWLVLTQ
jgi:hypothetical protein